MQIFRVLQHHPCSAMFASAWANSQSLLSRSMLSRSSPVLDLASDFTLFYLCGVWQGSLRGSSGYGSYKTALSPLFFTENGPYYIW